MSFKAHFSEIKPKSVTFQVEKVAKCHGIDFQSISEDTLLLEITYSGAYPFNIPGLQSAAERAEKGSF